MAGLEPMHHIMAMFFPFLLGVIAGGALWNLGYLRYASKTISDEKEIFIRHKNTQEVKQFLLKIFESEYFLEEFLSYRQKWLQSKKDIK